MRLHGIVIYLSIKLSLFCSLFKIKTDPKNCFFSRGSGLFKRRRSAENTLISNVIVKFLQDEKKYRKRRAKYQPIFLLVFSGSRVTKSQVY